MLNTYKNWWWSTDLNGFWSTVDPRDQGFFWNYGKIIDFSFFWLKVDYILGDNPLQMSYMVGYGARYPRRIHHRGSSLPSVQVHPAHIGCKAGSRFYLSPNPNPNVLVGAVVGGPNSSDAFPDSRPFFQESEPTTYINAPLVGLLAYFSAHPWFPQKCKGKERWWIVVVVR